MEDLAIEVARQVGRPAVEGRAMLGYEYDGRGHCGRFDERRMADLGLPTLRLTEADVLKDISLTERLQAMGYCLPRGRSCPRPGRKPGGGISIHPMGE